MSRRPDADAGSARIGGADERGRDALLDLLAHRHRRAVLSILRERDAPMHLCELARELAAREGEDTRDRERRELQDRLYLSLYHRHVPKLVEAGVVRFDRKRRTVGLAADPDADRRGESADDAAE